jgi:competence protein ComEA
VELPPGPMKKKVQSSCLECHDLSRITKQKHDKQWWAKTLTKMVGYGAQVDDSEQEALLNYLSKNFGQGKVAAKSAKK